MKNYKICLILQIKLFFFFNGKSFLHNLWRSFSANFNAREFVWCIETELFFSDKSSKDNHLLI